MGIKKGYLTKSNPDILPSWQVGCSYNSVKAWQLKPWTSQQVYSISMVSLQRPSHQPLTLTGNLQSSTETNRPYGPTIQFTCRMTYANEDDNDDDNDNKENERDTTTVILYFAFLKVQFQDPRETQRRGLLLQLTQYRLLVTQILDQG